MDREHLEEESRRHALRVGEKASGESQQWVGGLRAIMKEDQVDDALQQVEG